MTKPTILVPVSPTRSELPTHLPQFHQFLEDFNVILESVNNAEDLTTLLKTKASSIDGLWVTSAFFRIGGFNQFIPHLPSTLKVISFSWVGSNMFDIDALTAKGIILTNVGNVSARDVADVALLLTLGTFRFSSHFESRLKEFNGDITKARATIGSTEVDSKGQPVEPETPTNWSESLTVGGKSVDSPYGKVAGIVGLGSIGTEIAIRLNAIGLKIKYTKRTQLSEEQSSRLSFPLEYVSNFNDLISQVDVLVLAVPHTPETIDLINSESIKLVKPGIRIVNIGRGSAIDEDVLLQALDERVVNSVGLDVFQNEPTIDPRFINRPDVTILPHLAAFTVDTFRNSSLRVIENLRDVLLDGGKGVSAIN